jgi:succinoglycan biosynthesis protein ExoM
MGSICVELAVLDDPRILQAIESLDRQTRRPDLVMIAGSPRSPETLFTEAARRFPGLCIRVERIPGRAVDAREGSLASIDTDVTAFLDTDEVAPPEWLARVVEPIESGRADFTGGPTRPLRPPHGSIEEYVALLERSIYEDLVVGHSVTYLPLQNTAWRTSTLRTLHFDTTIPGAEDYDLEIRAVHAGFRGAYVPEAWVYHDKSDETELFPWLLRRYKLYHIPMAMSLLKNGELGERLSERRRPVRHPLRYLDAMMKPPALLTAAFRERHRRAVAPSGRPTP